MTTKTTKIIPIKVVTKQQVSEAVESLLDETNDESLWPFDMEPEDINNGSCEDFAMAVLAYLKFPSNLILDCGERDQPELWHHVWLKGTFISTSKTEILYFDCEVPDGVDHPKYLPFFQRT